MSISEFHAQADRFVSWSKIALQDWHEITADPRGGFAEFRTPTGAPDFEATRRVRVQFRLAYVYALGGYLGWYDKAKDACDQAWHFATQQGCQLGPLNIDSEFKGCAHLVAGNGQLIDPFRDTYAQSFIILAGAWRYRAFGDTQSLETAKATLQFLEDVLPSEFGGFEEGFPIPKSPRRQNPHMHLFEALLALFEATKEDIYLSKIHGLYNLFEQNFFDQETGLVFERFNTDWTKYKDGGPIEPGHMMEWAWLLSEYERLTERDMTENMSKLVNSGFELGFRKHTKFIIDSCDINGITKDESYRSWPQTELIKANVGLALKGELKCLPIISNSISRMFETYFNTEVPSGWHDKLDSEGKVIIDNMQSSTFYHIICAAAEVYRLKQAL